jgi:glutamine amidotransferase
MAERGPLVAIVDYGMGNLFSVEQACRHAGLTSIVTSKPQEALSADGVILPGIGAMPDAVAALRATGMDDALRRIAAKGRPLFGICLGMQLLMREGTEFGHHAGLDIIPGTVIRFTDPMQDGRALKVPSIGWNAVEPVSRHGSDPWVGTPLAGIPPGAPFYFVHSYHVALENPAAVLATTRYGDIEYCSALGSGSVFGCQFHPERSGAAGLGMYHTFSQLVADARPD